MTSYGPLKSLPEPELQEFVLDRIDDPAARPAELSEPARFPYPSGQAYYFERTSAGAHDAFLILFDRMRPACTSFH